MINIVSTHRTRFGLSALAMIALGGCGSKPQATTTSSTTTAGTTASAGRNEIEVGFLPVTCHLTCPVTDFATRTSKSNHFASRRFTDFPTMVETMKSGRLQASFMIAPLAMKLREQGVPVKICYLGHRDGSEVMVAKNNPAKNLADLKGKKFAIPSKYSNQYLVIRKLMVDQGLQPTDFQFIEMPPPDMPGALATGAIDAYFVGEPHAAKAEVDGTGRVLYYAKDIWPHFISCVLVVHEDLIKQHPDEVRDLVRGIAQSGEWADKHRVDAAKVVSPYFRQKESLVRYVLTSPPDRVSYRMLTPTDADLQQIHDMAIQAGILRKPISMKDLIDREFIPKDIKPADIDMKDAGKPL
ncbi:MAG: ABC transporter substrate-binding protein [Abitibacteriaceae bacterium]|nr:ABC transporter substrate-binding protein [Abditibacteriaceae bacterium]